MINVPVFDYSSAPQRDSVVVLAAGPSTASNKDQILKYCEENNSLIFGATYDYSKIGIVPNYTCFADIKKFEEQKNIIKTDIIIRGWTLQTNRKCFNSFFRSFSHKSYQFGEKQNIGGYKNYSVYGASQLKFDQHGRCLHSTIGITGLASFLMALMCRPKTLLFTGIDGKRNSDGKKEMFDGTLATDDKKAPKVIKFMQNTLFPYMTKIGVKVQTFDSVYIYGLDKSVLEIEVI